MMEEDAARVLKSYPRVFFACHDEHVTDPATTKVLSSNQVNILQHLDTVEPTGLADLARHMGVTASTMSISVERLVLGGYVERERNAEDGRRVELRVTQAGLRVRRAQSVLNSDKIKSLLG